MPFWGGNWSKISKIWILMKIPKFANGHIYKFQASKTEKPEITENNKFPIWLEPARAEKQLWWRSVLIWMRMRTISININCPMSKLIVQPQCSVINHEIRDSGCRGSIRLVKSVWRNEFSDYFMVKNDPKSNFHIKFGRKSPKLTYLTLDN